MATYERAPKRYLDALSEAMEQWHGDLAEHEVTIDLLLAHAARVNGFPNGPALKKNGQACKGLVKIVSLKDRVKGAADAEILLDGDECGSWTDGHLLAILDHELTHLEIQFDDDGLVLDDIGRPKLKMRYHDIEFGWFTSVANRHGDESVEVQQAESLFDNSEFRQIYLPGLEPHESQEAVAAG